MRVEANEWNAHKPGPGLLNFEGVSSSSDKEGNECAVHAPQTDCKPYTPKTNRTTGYESPHPTTRGSSGSTGGAASPSAAFSGGAASSLAGHQPLSMRSYFIADQNPRHPAFMLVEGEHPLREDPRLVATGIGPGRTFVYLQDTSEDVMLRDAEYFNTLEIPDMASTGGAGWLKLNSGDVVFARELDKGCVCGCDDVTQAALVNEQLLRAIPNGNKLVDNFLDAKQRALGDRELRGPSLPVEDPDTGIFTGGTAFERTPNAHSFVAPSVANKCSPESGMTTGLTMRQDLQKTAVAMASAGYEYLPRNHREAMKMQAELVNAPVIGDETNMFFGNTQYNLASAQPKSSSDRDLQGQLGDSGIVHKDGNDAPGALTGMVSSPDMPDNYDKGTFHLVEIGAYASLEETQVMYFSGLRRHGGTPAHAPDGEVVKKWA
ncbi:hypothetical protein FA95DRAFT_1613130, partial [Auriscalpium vulgare]